MELPRYPEYTRDPWAAAWTPGFAALRLRLGLNAMDVTKPYEFIWLGAMDVTKPYKSIGCGAMDVIKPYKWFGVGLWRALADSAPRCTTHRGLQGILY